MDNSAPGKKPPERLDLKLSEKQAEQMFEAAQLATPLEIICPLNSMEERLIFNMKLLYSVFFYQF